MADPHSPGLVAPSTSLSPDPHSPGPAAPSTSVSPVRLTSAAPALTPSLPAALSPAPALAAPAAIAQMPPQMQQYIKQLESWALANEKDAKRDSLKLWSLKTPAIVSASVSGVLGSLGLPPAIPILIGAVGAVCVALDGIIHPGKMRGFHVRALFDLRALEGSIENKWNIASLRHANSDELAAAILESAEQEKAEISEYLKRAEGSDFQETPHRKIKP
jgi:hypothetical protein